MVDIFQETVDEIADDILGPQEVEVILAPVVEVATPEPEVEAIIPPAPVVIPEPQAPPAEKEEFNWEKAQNNGSLSYLKKGSEQAEQTRFLQENLQAVGALGEIPDNHFGHYGPKTSAAVTSLQTAFKDAGAKIKVDDGNVYVQGWAALAALKETGTKLVDGKIPEDKQEDVLAAYKANLGKSVQLALGSFEKPYDYVAATSLPIPAGHEKNIG